MTTIYLTGELGRLFGRKWKLAVSSPGEALRAIEANKPGLIAYLAEAGDRGIDFRVKVNGDSIKEDALLLNRANTVIRFSPVVRGRKDEIVGIIIGVVLVAVTWGAAAGYLGFGMKAFMAANAFGITGMTYGALIGGIGISMALGGISRMLAPNPKSGAVGSDGAGQPSYLFNGPVNTTAQGGCVPLAYGGPLLIGSQVISAGIYSEDMGGTQEQDEGPFTESSEDADVYDPDFVPPAPTNLEARSLRTRQKARVLDLLGEGEMSLCDANGAVVLDEDRNKAILFDLTPSQNNDGSFAHQGFSTAFRPGTADQTWMPGFPAAESETAVETKVIKGSDKNANAVQRTIPAGSHNAVRITVRVPALYRYDDKGNRHGTLLHYGIQIKLASEDSASWREVVGSNPLPGGELDGLLQGETVQPYTRSYRVPLWGVGPWDVRVLRETTDSADPAKLQNDLYWQSYTTIIDRKFTYRHSAVVGSEFDAEKFPRIPARAFRVRGCKVRVPSNYNPETRNYDGVWDGLFKASREWTNNPAWIFYDLATHPRYGAGNYISDGSVDRWALYEIGRYCDGVDGSGNYVGVDAGKGDGSREPRFAANVYIQSQEDAYKVLSDFASIFRGMVFWATGLISAVQDSPKSPRFSFTNANVIGGDFVYSGSDRQARHTVAYVQWNDPDDYFIAKPLEVPNESAIAKFGVRPVNIVAFGCTSRGQARRAGSWLLLTEEYENETVTFRTQLHGARARPGDIARIRDRYDTAGRMGGRVLAVGAGSIELDAPVTLLAGQTYTLFVAKQDGTETELAITSGAGTLQTLAFTGDATGVERMAVWILRSDAVEPVLYRILNVKEMESHQFELIGLRYVGGKFTAVENGEDLDVPPTSDLPTSGVPIPPTDLQVRESAVATADGRTRFLDVSWRGSASRFVRGYRVEIRTPGGAWENLDEFTTELRSTRFAVTVLGQYAFRVTTIGYTQISDPANITYTLAEVAPPGDVTGISVTPISNGFEVKWDDDLGDLGYYRIFIAATSVLPGAPTYAAPGGTSQKTLANIGSLVERHIWIQKALHRVGLYGPATYAGSFTTLKSTAATETTIFTALNGKNRTFIGPVEPTAGMVPGDVWFDTSDLNRIYRFDGTDWVDIQKVLTEEDFGIGVRPVEVVDALPSTGNFKGRIVLLKTDDKLYRWTNDVVGTGTTYWSAAIQAVDINGELTSTQIGPNSIGTAALIADAVTAGKIAAAAVGAYQVGTNLLITNEANIGSAVIKEVHIAEATIATGKIKDLAVKTIKIDDYQVTIPVGNTNNVDFFYGSGAYVKVNEIEVDIDYPLQGIVFCRVFQGYAGSAGYAIEIRRQSDGSIVAAGGGSAILDSTVIIEAFGLAAGTHTLELWWRGDNANIFTGSNTLGILGGMK